MYIFIIRGPGSSVGIATGYGLDSPGIESQWGRDFPHLSRPALGTTQPPVQWVPGLSQGVKSDRGVTLTPHTLLVLWSWQSRAIPLLPLWAVRPVQSFSACTRVHFTYIFIFQLDCSPDLAFLQFSLACLKRFQEATQRYLAIISSLNLSVPSWITSFNTHLFRWGLGILFPKIWDFLLLGD
jgi:hypothetical protein